MDKIFMDAKDQNVAATMVYVRKTDNHAHKTKDGTTVEDVFTRSELIDAYKKGIIIYDVSHSAYHPVARMVEFADMCEIAYIARENEQFTIVPVHSVGL
mgnify:CR=1 FL=1